MQNIHICNSSKNITLKKMKVLYQLQFTSYTKLDLLMIMNMMHLNQFDNLLILTPTFPDFQFFSRGS